MPNENIVRGIFQLGIDMAEVEAGLNKTLSKYKAVTVQTDEQVKKIQELTDKEAKLIEGRAKSQNPSSVAIYNKRIEETKKQITALTAETKKLGASEVEVTTRATQMQKAISDALQISNVNAMRKKLEEIKKEFSSVSTGAKKFLSDTKAAGSGEGFLSNIKLLRDADGQILASRGNLIALKRELANATDPQKVEVLAESIGHIDKKLREANEAAKAFTSGNKFKTVGSLLEEAAVSLISMDFEGAAEKSKLLLEVTKKISFADVVKGAKQVGETLLNIGKSLLVNPIFLLASAGFAIFEAFEAFNKSAERTEEVLKGIDEAVKSIIEDTEKLANANRDLALQNQLDAGRITKLNADKLKNQNKFKDEYLEIVKKTQEAQKKVNEDADKAREEDGFQATKRIFEALGGETDLTKTQKEGLRRIQEQHNKEILELQKNFQLENQKALIDEANDEAKKRKEALDKYRKFLDDELKLNEDFKNKLNALDKENTNFNIANRLAAGSNEQVKAQFEEKKLLLIEETQTQKKALDKQISDAKAAGFLTKELQKRFAADRLIINKELVQGMINIDQERQLALLDNDVKLQIQRVEEEKVTQENILSTSTDGEEKIAAAKVAIEEETFNKTVAILEKDLQARKLAGFSIIEQEKSLAALRDQHSTNTKIGSNDVNNKNRDAAIKSVDEIEKHEEAALKLRNARQSTELFNQLSFERQKLDIIEASLGQQDKMYQEQADKVAQIEKDAIKARRLEDIGYFESIANASFQAANQIISAKIQETDKLTGLQEKRVEDARSIADKGNSQMLELEQKRLDDLNKKKEKYVRQQQQLASLELIANTAVTVSKAAAEGGAGAAITIAAALIALTAGLISARQIAGQAAFYSGGEFSGYTGDGNPVQESTAVGRKPYTYHKREFIFNHKDTDKYRDIFKRIHGGDIDLRDWQTKVKLFDGMQKDFNIKNPYIIKAVGGLDGQRLDGVEKLLGQLIRVTEGKDSPSFSLDKEGLYYGVKKYGERRKFIDKLAR